MAFSFFLFFGPLVFCDSLCCMRREGLAMQCLRMTQKSTRTSVWLGVCVCVRMWAGWSVCNQKYTHIRIYIHTSTHTLEFRGNTSILASPSSKVGLFLPHLVVTWLLSANQGFFLNEPLPQDMFLKVFFFLLKTAATLVNANWSLLRWLFLTVLHLDSDDSCPLYTFFPLEIWVLTRKMRNHGLI